MIGPTAEAPGGKPSAGRALIATPGVGLGGATPGCGGSATGLAASADGLPGPAPFWLPGCACTRPGTRTNIRTGAAKRQASIRFGAAPLNVCRLIVIDPGKEPDAIGEAVGLIGEPAGPDSEGWI